MNTSIRVGVAGASGRMGQAVRRALEDAEDMELASTLARGGNLKSLVGRCDVVIDFSRPELLLELAPACAEAGIPLVSGTTGLDDSARTALEAAAARVAVVHAPNMSIGVNILLQAIEKAIESVPKSWRCAIHEVHHAGKQDSPSGTALRLGAVVEGRRGQGSVEYSSERTGTVVGDHDVRFLGPDETLEFSHHAGDRAIFARGALHAARWVRGRDPGLYGMAEVLALK